MRADRAAGRRLSTARASPSFEYEKCPAPSAEAPLVTIMFVHADARARRRANQTAGMRPGLCVKSMLGVISEVTRVEGRRACSTSASMHLHTLI